MSTLSTIAEFISFIFTKKTPVANVEVSAPVTASSGQQHASISCKGFIKRFETCKLRAYPDPKTKGAPWTCGWGSTGKDVTSATIWTQEQADARFEHDVLEAEMLVRHYVIRPMTQGQFDAFVSIFQNVGPGNNYKNGIGQLTTGKPSTLLSKFNYGDFAGCKEEWLKWDSPGSSVEKGLERRRVGELGMFNS